MQDDQDDVTLEPEDENNKQKSPYMNNEGDEFIPDDGEGNIPATKDAVKDLREKLKKAIAEKQEYMDGWQRSKAEFINARKRDEESRKEIIKFANEGLLMDIVPVLDSFTMAFSNKEAWEKVDQNWRIGVEHIYSQLKGIKLLVST
jgi:molecular chaperone GrpE